MSSPEFVSQEWYCTKSGGGCGGYITVKLNMAINGVVEMICPKCKHKHQRCIENGVVKEQGRHNSEPTEEICATIADWSAKPRTKRLTRVQRVMTKKGWLKRSMANRNRINERDAAIIRSDKDIISQGFLDEAWDDKAANER